MFILGQDIISLYSCPAVPCQQTSVACRAVPRHGAACSGYACRAMPTGCVLAGPCRAMAILICIYSLYPICIHVTHLHLDYIYVKYMHARAHFIDTYLALSQLLVERKHKSEVLTPNSGSAALYCLYSI